MWSSINKCSVGVQVEAAVDDEDEQEEEHDEYERTVAAVL